MTDSSDFVLHLLISSSISCFQGLHPNKVEKDNNDAGVGFRIVKEVRVDRIRVFDNSDLIYYASFQNSSSDSVSVLCPMLHL